MKMQDLGEINTWWAIDAHASVHVILYLSNMEWFNIFCRYPAYFDGFYLVPTSFLDIGAKGTFTQHEISFKMVYNMTMFDDSLILRYAPGAQNRISDFHRLPVA